jgi:hypothetical protein
VGLLERHMGRHQQAPRNPLLKPDEGLFENINGKLRCARGKAWRCSPRTAIAVGGAGWWQSFTFEPEDVYCKELQSLGENVDVFGASQAQYAATRAIESGEAFTAYRKFCSRPTAERRK